MLKISSVRQMMGLLLIFGLTSCARIASVEQPLTAKTGEVIEVTLTGYSDTSSIEQRPPISPSLAIQLPHNWQVIEPVSYTGQYTGQLQHDEALFEAVSNRQSKKPDYYWWVGAGEQLDVVTKGLRSNFVVPIKIGPAAGIYYLDYELGEWYYGVWRGGHLRKNIPITITANYGGGWLYPSNLTTYLSTNQPSLTIPIEFVNLGEIEPDRFQFSVKPPTGWQVQFFTGGQPITQTPTLTFQQRISVLLEIIIPSNTPAEHLKFPVIATSALSPTATSTTWIDLHRFDERGIKPPEARNIDLVGQIGGQSLTIAIKKPYVYLGEGKTMSILDMSNPASPTVLSRLFIGHTIEQLLIAEERAYLRTDDGIHIIDISDPKIPREVSFYNGREYYDMLKVAAYLYLMTENGLLIINVSDITTPREIGYYTDVEKTTYPNMIRWQDRLYVTAGGNLYLFDISQPANPILVSQWISMFRSPRQMLIHNQVMYVNDNNDTLKVFDINTEITPTLLSYLPIGDEKYDMALSSDYLYIAGANELLILNVSNPTQPFAVNLSVITNRQSLVEVAINFPYLYLVDAADGIRTLDVTDPVSPQEINQYNNMWLIRDGLVVKDNYAYLGTWQGVRIVDISAPSFPVDMGEYHQKGVDDIALIGDTLYVAGYTDGLQWLDITDPIRPQLMGRMPTTGTTHILISENHAYVGVWDGMYIMDVSDPNNPAIIGDYRSGQAVHDMAIHGDYLYMAVDRVDSPRYDVDVLDITDPTQPKETLRYIFTAYAKGIEIKGDYLYVADGYKGLRIFDISKPPPVSVYEIARYDFDYFEVWDVHIQGDYAYLFTNSGFQIVDIQQPLCPYQVAYFDTAFQQNDKGNITFDDHYIYLVSEEQFLVLNHKPTINQCEKIYLPLLKYQ